MEELFKSAVILRSGILYNVAAASLVSIACLFSGLSILGKTPKRSEGRRFAYFLILLGACWLISGAMNLLSWLDQLMAAKQIAFFLKLLIFLPVIPLGAGSINRAIKNERASTFIYSLAALAFWAAALSEPFSCSANYWGVGWQNGLFASIIYLIALMPIALSAAAETAANARAGRDLSLPLAVIVYLLVDSFGFLSYEMDWIQLLIRLGYLAAAAAAYVRYIGAPGEEFIAPGQEKNKAEPRIPFFFKLLGLFLVVSIVPIATASGLLYLTFAEIINLYVYKPLLFGLKASREQFLAALQNAQIQAIFLLGLTFGLVVVAAVLTSRGLADSLKRVGLGMKRISGGDFSFRIKRESNDEIGDLVNYFNDMSAEIKRARDIMENWNRELDAEVKKKTKELREAYEQLISLDKLKTEFMSNISHELRTPLAHIENFSSLFYEGLLGPLTEEQKQRVKTIREANQRELALVNRLLNFSEMESGKFFLSKEPQRLHPLVLEAIEIQKARIHDQKVQITTNLSAENDNFAGNKEKMVFALADLIDNAVKFSPENPMVAIETKNAEDTVQLSIKDNGIGIATDQLERIFDKFYQVDASWTRKYGGTGLGLALVRNIILAHEGKIRAESSGEGTGTTIRIELPIIFT